MTRAERLTGVLFILLGVYVTLYSFVQLGFGTMKRPGPGSFTLVCGAGILVMSVLWLVTGWKEKDETPLFEKGGWIPPSFGVGVTLLYALLIEPLGYILSTAVFIALWQVAISRAKPLTVILSTLIGTGIMWVLFKYLLGVPLPTGLLRY